MNFCPSCGRAMVFTIRGGWECQYCGKPSVCFVDEADVLLQGMVYLNKRKDKELGGASIGEKQRLGKKQFCEFDKFSEFGEDCSA